MRPREGGTHVSRSQECHQRVLVPADETHQTARAKKRPDARGATLRRTALPPTTKYAGNPKNRSYGVRFLSFQFGTNLESPGPEEGSPFKSELIATSDVSLPPGFVAESLASAFHPNLPRQLPTIPDVEYRLFPIRTGTMLTLESGYFPRLRPAAADAGPL